MRKTKAAIKSQKGKSQAHRAGTLWAVREAGGSDLKSFSMEIIDDKSSLPCIDF